MKIAVTYENGNIFQHFGHTPQFKLFTAENGTVTDEKVIDTLDSGHGALAGLLAEQGVNVLICGGIGGGAAAALAEHGVELVAGISGEADAAAAAYLRGELKSSGANCDRHGASHACDDHPCGAGGCGAGGCAAKGKNTGRLCLVHYRGTLNDGSQFDSSYDRGEPLSFICGAGMMIPGFDAAVADMEVGEKRDVHLPPAEAYGEADPEAIFSIRLDWLPGAESLNAGDRAVLQDGSGRPIPAAVLKKDAETVTFDANHELAGRELNFAIELLEVRDPEG